MLQRAQLQSTGHGTGAACGTVVSWKADEHRPQIRFLGYRRVRGALPALGADQFDRNDPKERKQLGGFFNWLLLSITLGATFGITVIVWVATQKSTWDVGFFSQMIIALLGFIFLALGKPFYRNRVAGGSPLVRALQVFVVVIKN